MDIEIHKSSSNSSNSNSSNSNNIKKCYYCKCLGCNHYFDRKNLTYGFCNCEICGKAEMIKSGCCECKYYIRRTIHASELMKSMTENFKRKIEGHLNALQSRYVDKTINEINAKVIKDKPEFDKYPKKALFEGNEYDPYQELMKYAIAFENVPENMVNPGDLCIVLGGQCCPRMRRLISLGIL